MPWAGVSFHQESEEEGVGIKELTVLLLWDSEAGDEDGAVASSGQWGKRQCGGLRAKAEEG